MGNIAVKSVDAEKDLEFPCQHTLKHVNIAPVIKTTNKLIGFIRRHFTFKSEKKIILTLYNSLVRPVLDYNVQFWSPFQKKNLYCGIEQQKLPQCFAINPTKIVSTSGINELNLFSLTKRILMGSDIAF